jgi:hypothetical protein
LKGGRFESRDSRTAGGRDVSVTEPSSSVKSQMCLVGDPDSKAVTDCRSIFVVPRRVPLKDRLDIDDLLRHVAFVAEQ